MCETKQSGPPDQRWTEPKVPTHIPGLDMILNGGVPKGAMTLLAGGPGTGKTMLGLEFLYRGGRSGRPGVLLTFEEKDTALRRYAACFGWDLAELEQRNLLSIIPARIQPEAVLSGDFDLKGILGLLSARVEALGAECLFIDAPDVFLRLLDNLSKERAQIHAVYTWLQDRGLTCLMSVKGDTRRESIHPYDFLEYMADCVVHLDQRVVEQISTRRLRIVKYRGSDFSRNEYPFSISKNGVWIIPVTRASLRHRALGENLPSGIPGLDDLLGGGYRRNSCTLISGSSGTGKTTFVCSFARAVIAQGERLLYLNFEESWDALVSCMISPGIDLDAAMASGRLEFASAMPESQGIEEHLIEAFGLIETFEPRHLVVDAISACRRMGSRHAAFDYLLRLIDHCKQKGITALLTNLVGSRDAADEISGIDLSSVIDTVIVLRNQEEAGRFVRKLAVLKSRGRAHSNRIHEFTISDRGIDFLKGEGGDD
ncbi:circadian clock protein KaiC [Desulfatiferula olefinivorans]